MKNVLGRSNFSLRFSLDANRRFASFGTSLTPKDVFEAIRVPNKKYEQKLMISH